jgi:hypothetical protein
MRQFVQRNGPVVRVERREIPSPPIQDAVPGRGFLHPYHDPTPIGAIVVGTSGSRPHRARKGFAVYWRRRRFVHHSRFRLPMSPSGQSLHVSSID